MPKTRKLGFRPLPSNAGCVLTQINSCKVMDLVRAKNDFLTFETEVTRGKSWSRLCLFRYGCTLETPSKLNIDETPARRDKYD